MKYLCLLRGVNVGGKGAIKMSDLKEMFVQNGFTNVSTYINSGNIVFESEEKDIAKLTQKIESLLSVNFFIIKIVVISHPKLKTVLANIPKEWITEDFRKYIAFVKDPFTPEDLIKEMQLKEGIDFAKKGSGVVYMSTKLSGLTKSGFPKLIAKKIYQDITIRNLNTIQKLIVIMEKD